MRGMSIKAKIGWALALALGFLAFMAAMVAQPAWGFHDHYQYVKHPESRVHYYLIAFACNVNRLDCFQLPPDEFPTYDKCFDHLTEVQTRDRYALPGLPLVLGKCISWSPSLDNIPVPSPEIETWMYILPPGAPI